MEIETDNIYYPVRSRKLREQGYANYSAYLMSEHWTQRRADYTVGHEPICRYCECTTVDLHHRTYARLGAERDADLQWLCRVHHEEAHKFGRVRWATYRQRNLLINQGFPPDMIYAMTFGQAFDLIARLCRGECVPPAPQ